MLLFKLEQLEQEEKKQQNNLRTLLFTWRNINYKQHSMSTIADLEAEKKNN